MAGKQTTSDEINKLKIEVLIVECVMAALLSTLIGFVVYLYLKVQTINKLLKVLDPMGKYKKVGPSLYIKRPERDITSISSSFKHFNGRGNDYSKRDDKFPNVKEETLDKNEIGTLDRNFFTKNNFNFGSISTSTTSSKDDSKKTDKYVDKNRRKDSEAEAMEAITKLDRVLY